MLIFLLIININNTSWLLLLPKSEIKTVQSLAHLPIFNTFFNQIAISNLQFGDIAFKHPEAFKGPIIIDHCLICTDYNASTDTYSFIEAHFHHGVQLRYEKRENLSILGWGPYARVISANDTQKQNAISFAKQQIGREFQSEWMNKNYNPTDLQNDSLADEWYCSELIWAAYYNCNNYFADNIDEKEYIYGDGIDIDFNGWDPIFSRIVVAPRDIMFDNNVRRIFFPFI